MTNSCHDRSSGPQPALATSGPRSRVAAGVALGLVLFGAAQAPAEQPAGERAPTVYGLLHVRQDPDVRDYAVHRRTQLALLKSRLVLKAALREPGVADSPLLKQLDDPLVWLEDKLQVDYPMDGEVLRVGLNGDRPEELVVIVDAVMTAYLRVFAPKEPTARSIRLEQLREFAAQHEQAAAALQARLQAQAAVLTEEARARDAAMQKERAALASREAVLKKVRAEIEALEAEAGPIRVLVTLLQKAEARKRK